MPTPSAQAAGGADSRGALDRRQRAPPSSPRRRSATELDAVEREHGRVVAVHGLDGLDSRPGVPSDRPRRARRPAVRVAARGARGDDEHVGGVAVRARSASRRRAGSRRRPCSARVVDVGGVVAALRLGPRERQRWRRRRRAARASAPAAPRSPRGGDGRPPATTEARSGSGTSVVPSARGSSAASTKEPPKPPTATRAARCRASRARPSAATTPSSQPIGILAQRAEAPDRGLASSRTPPTVSTSSCWSSVRSKFMRASVCRSRRAAEDELRDDVLLDLVGAAVDGGGARVVEEPRARLLGRRDDARLVRTRRASRAPSPPWRARSTAGGSPSRGSSGSTTPAPAHGRAARSARAR